MNEMQVNMASERRTDKGKIMKDFYIVPCKVTMGSPFIANKRLTALCEALSARLG